MERREFDKNVYMLVDTYCRKGHINDMQFGNNPLAKQDFIRENGLIGQYANYVSAGQKFDMATNQEEFLAAKKEVEKAAEEIRKECKRRLEEQGLDMAAIYGAEPSLEERKKLLFEQLEQMGMSEEFIRRMNFDDIEQLIYDGSPEFEYSVEDTPEARARFNAENIDYNAEDGRLRARATLHAAEGVAFDDTPNNRKLLDENEITYIRMAMNKNPHAEDMKLFVPSTWMNSMRSSVSNNFENYFNTTINSHFGRELLGGTMMAGAVMTAAMAGLVIHPVFAVAAYLLIRKTGVFNARRKSFVPTEYEKRALEKGHTVFKEENGKARYLYMHKGNLLSINAHDIRVPEYIKGVRLTPLQKQQFRMGELVKLEGRNGEAFHVRIDVTSPNSMREYYKELRNDNSVIPVPTVNDSDEAKLSYIEKTGVKGIKSIYGSMNYNPKRDEFLRKYNLHQTFKNYIQTESTLHRTTDEDLKRSYMQYLKNDDSKLKDIAKNELLSQINRNRSL